MPDIIEIDNRHELPTYPLMKLGYTYSELADVLSAYKRRYGRIPAQVWHCTGEDAGVPKWWAGLE